MTSNSKGGDKKSATNPIEKRDPTLWNNWNFTEIASYIIIPVNNPVKWPKFTEIA